ncbi:M16 family metallopeptidase [Shewanella cyperi]|uniref:M16 family metallopeptidase n=1 Tax=Shewanella cyperi TaxID=2814292 RepID=UPI001A949069|nr:pitrilysin family protein [Shewanella cyperi]QSX40139.1 insulinase family protein [Shewanella cyperi]
MSAFAYLARSAAILLLFALPGLPAVAEENPGLDSLALKRMAQPLVQLDGQVSSRRLDNGLLIRWLPLAGRHSASIASHVAVGSRHETAGQTGYAHLFEHMLFKGSDRAPGDSYGAWLGSLGASYNARTLFDATDFYLTLPSQALPLGIMLEADRLMQPSLSDEGLGNQQATVLAEMAQTIDNQPYFRVAMEFLLDQAKDTPYSHAIIGSRQDIENATPASLRAFYHKHYRPDAVTVALAGDISPAAIEELAQAFGPWLNPPGDAPEPKTSPRGQRPGPIQGQVTDERAPWPGLLLAWPTVGRGHADAEAVRLLELQLFQRLANELERAGIAGSDSLLSYSLPLTMEEFGMTNLVLVPRARTSLDTLAERIEAQLARLASEPLNERELGSLKVLWLKQRLAAIEHTESLALLLADVETRDLDHPLSGPWQRVDTLDSEDLMRVAREYFQERTIRLDLQPGWSTRFGKGLLELLPAGVADTLEDLAL